MTHELSQEAIAIYI